MQARDGRERACSERGAAGEPCAEAMARAKRAGRRRCLRQVSVGAEWVPSLEGWSGSGAARNAAVPQRSGPLGLARVRERAGADDVRSGAQRRRLAVKAPARAGTRALGTTRRASTRGFGAALARDGESDVVGLGARSRALAAESARTALGGDAGHPDRGSAEIKRRAKKQKKATKKPRAK
jgi:hypothetical protein